MRAPVWYVADYFYHEEAILTTWDIKHENFGWMLCWGDLVWVPFTYTLQALYLVHHPHGMPAWAVAGVVALFLAGLRDLAGRQRAEARLPPGPGRAAQVVGRRAPVHRDPARAAAPGRAASGASAAT